MMPLHSLLLYAFVVFGLSIYADANKLSKKDQRTCNRIVKEVKKAQTQYHTIGDDHQGDGNETR